MSSDVAGSVGSTTAVGVKVTVEVILGAGVTVAEITTGTDVSMSGLSVKNILLASDSHATSAEIQKNNTTDNLLNLIILSPVERYPKPAGVQIQMLC